MSEDRPSCESVSSVAVARPVDPFVLARQRDPRGDVVHAAMLAFWLFMLPLGTTPFAIVTAVVFIYALLRIWATAPAYAPLLRREPLLWILAVWAVWQATTLLWSLDWHRGLTFDLKIYRMQLPVLLALWPLVDRAPRLCWAVGAGVCAAATIQIIQFIGTPQLPTILWWHGERIPGRYPGLLHPASTAIVAMTGGLLAVAPAIGSRGVRRWAGVTIVIASLTGLALTGSRGPWIAAAVGFPIAVVLAWRKREAHLSPRRLAIVFVGSVVVLTAIVFAARGPLVMRFTAAWNEITAALVEGDYSSHTGSRIFQWRIAPALLAEHPWTGVGAGSYHEAARRYLLNQTPPREEDDRSEEGLPDPRRDPPPTPGLMDDPHSAFLYVAAVQGLPGILLTASFWGLLLWRSRGAINAGPFAPTVPAVVVGLFIAHIFDSHNLSTPGTVAVMFTLFLVAHGSKPHDAQP